MLITTIALLSLVAAAIRTDPTPPVLERTAASAVFAIDLGSSFLKMAAPKFNTTIDIILNEQSRRKTPTVIGFRKGYRYVGEEARSLSGRFPHLMLQNVNRLNGVTAATAETVDMLFTLGLGRLHSDARRGTASVDFLDVTQPTAAHREGVPQNFTPEVLTAMILKHAAELASNDMNERAASAVITVPYFFTQRQREALLSSAAIAGIQVISLAHGLTAAAFQLGIKVGGYGNATVSVVIADIGATKTEIGLFTFAPHETPSTNETDRTDRRVRAVESLGELRTIAVESLPYTGGGTVDRCVAEHIINAALVAERGAEHSLFAATADDGVAATSLRRYSLMRAARDLKESLSVNMVYSVTAEAVTADGQDFTVTASRQQLESTCPEAAVQVAEALRRLLTSSRARREPKPITVELMGGGSRMPLIAARIEQELTALYADDAAVPTIGRRLNADEDIAFGAAFLAARSSRFLRFRGFAVKDTLPCAGAIHVGRAPKPAIRPLFVLNEAEEGEGEGGEVHATTDPASLPSSSRSSATCDALPCRSSATFTLSATDSQLTVVVAVPHDNCTSNGGDLAAAAVLNELVVSNISDLMASALNNTRFTANSIDLRVRLEFVLSIDGVVEAFPTAIGRASRPKKKSASEAPPESSEPTDDSEEPVKKRTMRRKSKSPSAAKKASRHTYLELPVSRWVYRGLPLPLSEEEIQQAKTTTRAIDKLETDAREAAIAKNDLETFIIRLQEELVTTPLPQHSAALLQSAVEWFERRGSDEDCSATEYESYRAQLLQSLRREMGNDDASSSAAGSNSEL